MVLSVSVVVTPGDLVLRDMSIWCQCLWWLHDLAAWWLYLSGHSSGFVSGFFRWLCAMVLCGGFILQAGPGGPEEGARADGATEPRHGVHYSRERVRGHQATRPRRYVKHTKSLLIVTRFVCCAQLTLDTNRTLHPTLDEVESLCSCRAGAAPSAIHNYI